MVGGGGRRSCYGDDTGPTQLLLQHGHVYPQAEMKQPTDELTKEKQLSKVLIKPMRESEVHMQWNVVAIRCKATGCS